MHIKTIFIGLNLLTFYCNFEITFHHNIIGWGKNGQLDTNPSILQKEIRKYTFEGPA